MEGKNEVCGVEMELGCVFLRWAMADEVDITVDVTRSLYGNRVENEGYHGLDPFSSIVSSVHVLW